MKIVIAGSRDISISRSLFAEYCDDYIGEFDETIDILSGHAPGIDMMGEAYAIKRGYRLFTFLAEWDTYGKRAGYLRNYEMSKSADALLAFWDGESSGTRNMIDICVKRGIPVRVIKIDEEPEGKIIDVIDYND